MPRNFIVCGHLVTDRNHAVADYYKYPNLREFDKFIQQFRGLGYEFVGLNDYLKEDDAKKILLTFDDGYKVLSESLHPYMRANQIPYVVFILTDPLSDPNFHIRTVAPGMNSDSAGKSLFLTLDEILKLRNDGVHIGFHGTGHRKVESGDLNNDEIIAQLKIPSEYDHLFSRPLSFSYPYYAPDNFGLFNRMMKDKFNYDLFFDVKGFLASQPPHFFRVSIDGEKTLTGKNWLPFVLKRQMIIGMVNRVMGFFRKN